MATTPIRIYQRLDGAHNHNLIAVKRSRNGAPVADRRNFASVSAICLNCSIERAS